MKNILQVLLCLDCSLMLLDLVKDIVVLTCYQQTHTTFNNEIIMVYLLWLHYHHDHNINSLSNYGHRVQDK